MKYQEKITINGPIKYLPYVTPRVEKLLGKLRIKTIKDLLLYSPSRYLDFSNIIKINDINSAAQDNVTIQGQIASIISKRTWKRKMIITEAIIGDDTGSIKAIWFNQPFIAKHLRKGQFINLSGKISSRNTNAYFSHPLYETVGKADLAHTGRIIPIYPETAGLTSKWLRFLIKQALKYAPEIPETVPEEIRRKENFLPKKELIKNLHFPASIDAGEKSKKQLTFEELFAVQLMILGLKKRIKKQNAPIINTDIDLIKKFVDALPFKLTNAQKKSAWQILKDMEKGSPMNRLLNGDVGSGKTIVAAIASLNTAKQDWQIAYLAPTEILARQHFETFCKLLKPFKFCISLNTGSENKIYDPELEESYKAKKSDCLKKIEDKQIQIAIGTHALIQEKVKFNKLGLVIIDEQHRFGVKQRANLIKNSPKDKQGWLIPHLLSMTATPIPRSLMLTLYGDLDLSIIDEMPAGRQKIVTKIIPPKERKTAYQFIRNEIIQGRQAFVICPRIELTTDNEQLTTNNLEIKTAKEEYKKLSEKIFPDFKISLLHGKMKSKEKEKTMADFKENKANILVSTTVVEVGVDVPNATVMIIEGAERFGLAQLHQFRGRIGRGAHQSYCLLMPTSENSSSNERLNALLLNDSGFKLAEKDLQIRGPGEFIGEKQSGLADATFVSFADVFLIKKIQNHAISILKKDPELFNYPLLKRKVLELEIKTHLE